MTPLTFVFNEIRRSFGYVFNNLHCCFRPASNKSQNLHVSGRSPGRLQRGRWAFSPPALMALRCHSAGPRPGGGSEGTGGWRGSRGPLGEAARRLLKPGEGLWSSCVSLPRHPRSLSNFPHTESGFSVTEVWSVIKH